jgi:hypothetical protein
MTTNPAEGDTSDEGKSIEDPVLIQRAKLHNLAVLGKRIGYGLFLFAITLFLIGTTTNLTSAMATIIVVCLVVGSIVLAPAIVLGYGVGAAQREDRDSGRL